MSGDISLRPAHGQDAEWTHALRNMPHIRLASLDTDEISLDRHVRWWTAALTNRDRRLSVIVYDGEDVGVVRLDRAGDVVTLSIYVRPGLSGRGVGRQAIVAAMALASREWGITRFSATIREDNLASQRAFAAAGFVNAGESWTCLTDGVLPSDQSI